MDHHCKTHGLHDAWRTCRRDGRVKCLMCDHERLARKLRGQGVDFVACVRCRWPIRRLSERAPDGLCTFCRRDAEEAHAGAA